MICKHMECATFKKVAKAFDGKVYSKEFSIKCAVPCFGRSQLVGKEGDGMPCTIDVLLEDGTNCSVGCICHHAGRGVG